jgi:hypothetical protein
MPPVEFKDQRHYEAVWKSGGYDPFEPEVFVEMKDALASSSAGAWLPQVIQNVVKEAQEPLLVGTSLLERIAMKPGTTITFPAVGAITAEDIAEGQSYPEKRIQISGATVTAITGKSGLALAFTEETISRSQYDVVGLHLRAAGRALARHKEVKIFNFIRSLGTVCFDNKTPLSSMYGVTHGRALGGAGNGSVVMDDIFDSMAQIIYQGFMPNTLLMHPLSWVAWIKDPVLRAFALASGNGVFFASHTGNPAGRAPWDASSQGKLGVSGGRQITPGEAASGAVASALEAYDQGIKSAPQLPRYFPYPFTIIVSPFVRFDPATKLTDIYIFDRNELGALVVEHDVQVDEWDDKSVDIKKIKLKERYGFAVFNEGHGVGVLKNVSVKSNQVVFPAQLTQSVSGTISELPATTAVV